MQKSFSHSTYIPQKNVISATYMVQNTFRNGAYLSVSLCFQAQDSTKPGTILCMAYFGIVPYGQTHASVKMMVFI